MSKKNSKPRNFKKKKYFIYLYFSKKNFSKLPEFVDKISTPSNKILQKIPKFFDKFR